ncbi:MAG: hypothetical protein ACE15C_05940 [Phycisphaerae bacterium]
MAGLPFLNTMGSRWQLVAICAVAAVAVAIAVLACWHAMVGPAGQKMHFTCDACGYQWDEPAGASHACPKCGGAAVLKVYFNCPQCGNVFCGLETVKDAVGRFKYRLAGTSQWSATRPAPPTCPKCKVASPDIYERGVQSGVVGAQPSDDAAPVLGGN